MLDALRISVAAVAGLDLAAIAAWYTFSWPRSQWLGRAHYQGKTPKKLAALTFDDGPHPPFTNEVLDILRRENVCATFFLCGRNIDAHPDLARRIVDEEHLIGNHTYSHPYLYFQSRADIRRELDLTQQAIRRATGRNCKLFRPPYGARWVGLYPELRARQMDLIAWSCWPETHSTASEIVADAMRHLRPGAVYLLHDGIQAPGGFFARKSRQAESQVEAEDRVKRMIEALPALITKIRAQGYELVDVAQMFELEGSTTEERTRVKEA
jgi:peptidoglycan-N-acetylglucosamine deacetylase